VTETADPGRCGLCGTESTFLQASPWGQVCRLCLRAKSRKAVREASVAVSVPDLPCGICGQPLQVVCSAGSTCQSTRAPSGEHTTCSSNEEAERLMRESGTRYHASGVCALCGRHSPWLVDSEWGRIHEDCGYQRAATEKRTAEQDARTARDEALRAEGRQMERQHERAAVMRWLGDVIDGSVALPLRPGLTGAVGALQAALEAIEAGEHLRTKGGT
jgi:hypothetical protein